MKPFTKPGGESLGRAPLSIAGGFRKRSEGRATPRLAFVARAELDKKPADVRRMFDAVARRYDITNDVLSLGQDRRWRTDVVRAVDPAPGEKILDLAAGTGTSSQPFADAGAYVVPCDFSLGMLQVARKRGRTCPSLPATAPSCPSPTTPSMR